MGVESDCASGTEHRDNTSDAGDTRWLPIAEGIESQILRVWPGRGNLGADRPQLIAVTWFPRYRVRKATLRTLRVVVMLSPGRNRRAHSGMDLGATIVLIATLRSTRIAGARRFACGQDMLRMSSRAAATCRGGKIEAL